ncbi:MAG: winged helix-turn-helix transcriptional regulator [Fibrobacter sp.]|nr:winged helix-turn-helix transcriptional regulator [Fibrobacter sp.]
MHKYGSGIRRVLKLFKEAGQPLPEFRNQQGGFAVTVFAAGQKKESKIKNDAIINVTSSTSIEEKVPEKVPENQLKILNSMAENPHITIPELAIIVGISERKIRENIAKLKIKNHIERIGPDKGGHWKVIKKSGFVD